MTRNTYRRTKLLQGDLLLRDYRRTCSKCHEVFDESALARASTTGCCGDCAVTGVMRAFVPTGAAAR